MDASSVISRASRVEKVASSLDWRVVRRVERICGVRVGFAFSKVDVDRSLESASSSD